MISMNVLANSFNTFPCQITKYVDKHIEALDLVYTVLKPKTTSEDFPNVY